MEWVRERQEQFFYLAYSVTFLSCGGFLSGLGLYLSSTQHERAEVWVFNCVLPGLFQLLLGAALASFGCSAGLHSCCRSASSSFTPSLYSSSSRGRGLQQAAQPLLSPISTTESIWGAKLEAKETTNPSSASSFC
ncbi:hypothetical protein QOT17_010404 [Balamuthia mandrillaris]